MRVEITAQNNGWLFPIESVSDAFLEGSESSHEQSSLGVLYMIILWVPIEVRAPDKQLLLCIYLTSVLMKRAYMLEEANDGLVMEMKFLVSIIHGHQVIIVHYFLLEEFKRVSFEGHDHCVLVPTICFVDFVAQLLELRSIKVFNVVHFLIIVKKLGINLLKDRQCLNWTPLSPREFSESDIGS